MFQDMICALASKIGHCTLYTGTPHNLPSSDSLNIESAPKYSRESKFSRFASWGSFGIFALKKIVTKTSPDFIFAATNPPLMPHIAWLTSKMFGFKYGLLYWDIYPEHLIHQGFLKENALLTKILKLMNAKIMEDALFVTTISDQMASTLLSQSKKKNPNLKINVIHNWANTNHIRPIDKARNPFAIKHKQVDKFTVMYSGNMGASHGLASLIEAAAILQNDDRFSFLFIGDGLGKKEIEKKAEKLQLPNVTFLNKQKWDDYPNSIATADIAVISQAPGTEGLSMPSKTYSAMAAGCALLALTDPKSSLGELIVQENIGIAIHRDNSSQIVSSLQHLADNPAKMKEMKKLSRICAEEKYGSKSALQHFLSLMAVVQKDNSNDNDHTFSSRASNCTESKIKRAMDIAGAIFGLSVFSPLIVGTAIAVRINMGSPVLFEQTRPGLNEKLFTLKKFRTMKNATKKELWFSSDIDRTTLLGKAMRKASIDELPQLWNVLKGDISLVGPRPLLKEYLTVYTEYQKHRHDVKPGLTGWAQVNGRNKLTLSQRRKLDVWYVENWSLLLDLWIIARTAKQVLFPKDVIPIAQMSDVDDQGFEAALRQSHKKSL